MWFGWTIAYLARKCLDIIWMFVCMCVLYSYQPKDLLVADQREKHSSNPITPNAYKPCNSIAAHVTLSL